LQWLLHQSPERLRRADLATLTLLSRQADPELLAAAKPLLDALLARQPENPAVLTAAVTYHEALGNDGSALEARRRLAHLQGYDDDSRKQEAALWLGKHLSPDYPDEAAAYLWDAQRWWFNSGNGGDLGRRISLAMDEAKRLRRDDPQGTSSGGPGIQDRIP